MIRYSKFLSLILRHKPSAGNITLNDNGFAKVVDVLAALRAHVGPITRTELDQLVADNDKKRFAFNDHGDLIRASQGHSVAVDLKMEPQTPPERLFHGTKQRFLGSILARGLIPMTRQHVHLSPTLDTAEVVAARRSGDSVMLTVDTAKCPGPFFLSANGVWLTEAVPATALTIHYGDEA